MCAKEWRALLFLAPSLISSSSSVSSSVRELKGSKTEVATLREELKKACSQLAAVPPRKVPVGRPAQGSLAEC